MRCCFSGGEAGDRAHVVQPIGQLDEDHAHVLGHGQEHLADVLGLPLLVAMRAELRQLGDAVHQPGHLRPEALLDVLQRVLRVLRDVVQERRLDRDRVEAELGERLRRGDRVSDIRLAARPLLVRVRLDRETVGSFDAGQVGRGMVLPGPRRRAGARTRRGPRGSPPGWRRDLPGRRPGGRDGRGRSLARSTWGPIIPLDRGPPAGLPARGGRQTLALGESALGRPRAQRNRRTRFHPAPSSGRAA